MQTIYISTYTSPAGELLIGDHKGRLCLLDWKYRQKRGAIDERIKTYFQASYEEVQTPLHLRAMEQLEEYFKGERQYFDIPFVLAGSPFQKTVWELLGGIPYGKTISYLDLSRKFGNEKAIRAVASANGANAISILIPCHRVIGSQGEMTGYAGGINTKRKLLAIEGWKSNAPELF